MLELTELPGNIQVKSYLQKLLYKVPHALLFEGPKGVGKGEFARVFAKKLLQSDKKEHPDFREFFPEGKSHLHSIQSIRNLIQETEMPPFEAEQKVILLHEADRMLPTSANALLKTLEEPVSNVVIILISSHPESLLTTITSRCFKIPFTYLTQEEIVDDLKQKLGEDEARKVALLSHGSLEKARLLAEKNGGDLSLLMFELGVQLIRREVPDWKAYKDLDDPEEALSHLFYFYRDLHLLKEGADPSLLFYRERESDLRSCLEHLIPPIEEIQDIFEKLRFALEVHIPLSHSLATLM